MGGREGEEGWDGREGGKVEGEGGRESRRGGREGK